MINALGYALKHKKNKNKLHIQPVSDVIYQYLRS